MSADINVALYQHEAKLWAQHNFPNWDRRDAALGVAEEAGEVARAVLKQSTGIRGTYEEWDAEIQKECGDTFLSLCQLANLCGFDLAQAIIDRWRVVSQRDWVADPAGHGRDGA